VVGFRASAHSTNCQACDRLTRPKEVANGLRLAQQRAQKAQERAIRRWRLLQVLLEAAGLPSPDEASSPLALCHCGAKSQSARLMACGHVACEGHETCNCEGKELLVSLDFQKCQDSSVSSKIDGMVSAIQKILSDNPKVQCLIFSQWTSTLRKLEEALRAQGLDPLMPTGRRKGKVPKSIILLTTDFLCSEKVRRQGQEHSTLDEHAMLRHVLLMHPLYAAVKAEVLEQRILDFAKTNQVGVAPRTVLHRFTISDTIETSGELKDNVEV